MQFRIIPTAGRFNSQPNEKGDVPMPTTTTAPAATKTTATPAAAKTGKPHKPLPAPNSDFYYLYETLPAEELAIVKRVREFMETKVALITDYWVKDQFPFE